ncbi:Glutaminase 1 [Arthrobacter saudimassiliensis]|uniref:Glutaminase n=1 Tax=Arthrobacter saudimassiliensis TaxID=1461584 RepID=A0A078MNY3_9MICC|nr:Glutaminase 1 [Arthrobacter saudimassiliensis]
MADSPQEPHDELGQVDDHEATETISTGTLPDAETIRRLLRQAHRRYAGNDDGAVADHIPALADADPGLFGISLTSIEGDVYSVGDTAHTFTIQSISKAFVFALACRELGHEPVRNTVGVNNTGLPFDSVMALELNGGHPMNPMVNAGALATSALVPGEDLEAKWNFIRDGLSRFAGRRLELDEDAWASEQAANQRNTGIARLLESHGRMDFDAADATDLFTRQCSLLVTAEDLSAMGATLSAGGVNPVTGDEVVGPEVARDTLAVLASTGMYEASGDWLFEIGLPAKSGVSGGVVTVSPGKGGLATYSAPLDDAGTSVRGQLAAGFLSARLGLNLFASRPAAQRAARGD